MQALQRLKGGDAVVAMDPRLQRSPASIMVVEKVLKLARQCLAPQRQSRPFHEGMWGGYCGEFGKILERTFLILLPLLIILKTWM
ncbi:hypothetical protein Acr_28g0006050 [Actinidia rufa]|uniref:Uncharacterized protein n=1 Tax=Actinidia rufa TaxID=165716 RepID=A0A7J0H9U9_9ERIC|nr:hypothetical protein Acr_28g0006050 [Actinidia rufa]